LLASFRRREKSKSFVWAGGEMASGRRDLGGAEAMDQGDGEIATGGHNLWGVAGPQAGTVFLEGDIAHIMGAIFDAPMPTIEVQQTLWTGLGGRKGGDEIDPAPV